MADSRKKIEKLSGPEKVFMFLDQLQHPLKREIQEVRSIV
jgi:hypothetical protein